MPVEIIQPTAAMMRDRPPMPLKGKRFGRLRVVRLAGLWKRHGYMWECRCDCGAVKNQLATWLTRGHILSCGCYQREMNRRARSHGMSKSSEFKTWQSIHQRCHNTKDKQFKDYGARGIKVCKRWASFEKFYADMGPRPAGKTLDRRNNDQGYSPANCRWVTVREQNLNKRNSLGVDLTAYAAAHGITRQGAWHRFKRGAL